MAKYLSNIRLVLGATVLAVVISFAASYVTGAWHWFGRSGAIVTIAGVILSVRPLIRMGFSEWFRSLTIIDGGHFEPTLKEIEAEHQSKLDATAYHIGVYMALIGTIVWAYGDLIGGLPK